MHRSLFYSLFRLRGEMLQILQPRVVLSRLELLTPTLSVWCSNQLSYRTVMELCMARNTLDLLFQVLHLLYGYRQSVDKEQSKSTRGHRTSEKKKTSSLSFPFRISNNINTHIYSSHSLKALQKGGVPAAPSGTATLLRLSPNHQFRPRPTLAVTDFRHPRLSWLDGRCVQGPGTYSPRHG